MYFNRAKIKLMLSLLALLMIAFVVLGAAEYVYSHPNVYSKEVRGDRQRFNRD
jgi:hypothetical protein